MKGSFVLLAGLLLGLGTPGCRRAAPEAPALRPPDNQVWLSQEQASALRLSVMRTQAIPDALRVGGRVAFDDLRISHVFSPVSGRVVKLLAGPGDRLQRGAPLALISSPDIGSAWSDVVKARSNLDASQREYQRQKELYEAHAAALRDLEGAEDNFKQARAELERAEAKARLLRAGSELGAEDYVLRAPIDGEVIARLANPGMEVQGQYWRRHGGRALHRRRARPGARHWRPARAGSYGGQGRCRGAGAGGERTGQGLFGEGRLGVLDARSDHPHRQGAHSGRQPGTPAQSRDVRHRLHSPGAPPAVALPRSALLRLGDQTVVFVALGESPDGRLRFERRRVSVHEDESGDLYPVLRGLKAGETVVVAARSSSPGCLSAAR